MTYEPKTTRIELDIEGNGWKPFQKKPWVEFFVDMLHGTQRAVNVIARPYLRFPEGQRPTVTVEEREIKVKVAEGGSPLEIDLERIDWDGINDAIIVGQVKEWSFGPVTQETLDGLPEGVRERLVNEANKLYGKQGPLPKGGGGN